MRAVGLVTKDEMRNKSRLVLMEQMIMLLVFALAASVCVRIFVQSEQLSRRYEARDRAAVAAQNAAELMKKKGALAFVEEMKAVSVGDNTWVVYYDKDWNRTEGALKKYSLEITYKSEASGYIWRSELTAFTEEGEELFRIPVAGQIGTEVTADETFFVFEEM